MLTFNEGRACDAIIKLLEEREGAQRSNVRLHDHDKPGHTVELTFELGPRLYAMEHTGIEPFADFMKMDRESARLFDPIVAAVAHTVPANEVVDLNIPVGALTTPKNRRAIQHALIQFILESIPTLPLCPYGEGAALRPRFRPEYHLRLGLLDLHTPSKLPAAFVSRSL
jgi:hypothetical protein